MKLGRAFPITEAAVLDSNVPETEALWLGPTTYAEGAVVRRSVGGIQRRFVSAQAGNTGHDPADLDPEWWIDDGPTNRWAQFDQRLQDQTINTGSIYTKLQIVGRIDAVYVGNVSGQELRVVAKAGAEVVYDKTVGLVSTSRITNWARYFREPIVGLKDKGLQDLPSGYANLTLEVTISDPGETVKCGELVVALMADIGGTQWGAGLGNKSYSRIEEDDFGRDDIVKRGVKRTGEFGVIVDNRDLDDVTNLLDDCDGQAVLYIGDDRYAAMFIFGLLLSWREVVQWPEYTSLSMTLQSFVR